MPKQPKKHTIRFLNLVDDAKTRVRETTTEKILARKKRGEFVNLLDVREEREFLLSHIEGARWISKGVLERDVEQFYKNLDEEIVLYCGGGYRSVLAADNLQKMGYTRVYSMAGGFKLWKKLGGTISIT